eukprot:m.53119 g.53119  ORF g.53119 m.53119 type:complete len:50 (-) comp15391_c0_seq3:41-190(-)
MLQRESRLFSEFHIQLRNVPVHDKKDTEDVHWQQHPVQPRTNMSTNSLI